MGTPPAAGRARARAATGARRSTCCCSALADLKLTHLAFYKDSAETLNPAEL